MAEVHLIVPKGSENDVHLIWLNSNDAKHHCEQYNKELEGINSDLEQEDQIPEHVVVSMAIQDSNVLPYTAVYVTGGIIDKTVTGVYLNDLIDEMNETLYNNFDSQTDDARIFDSQGKEVFSYDHEAMEEQVNAAHKQT